MKIFTIIRAVVLNNSLSYGNNFTFLAESLLNSVLVFFFLIESDLFESTPAHGYFTTN